MHASTVVASLTLALSSLPAGSEALKQASAFAAIEPAELRAAAIFKEVAKVFAHARCANCHPASDRPMQTDGSRPHLPLVARGADGFGAAGLKCQSCHMEANSATGVPGAPHWHLAPQSMPLLGKTAGELCRQIKDPAQNGDRSVPVIIMHVAFDPLIKWSWEPGGTRDPAPGTHQDFVSLMNAWAQAGAACPAD